MASCLNGAQKGMSAALIRDHIIVIGTLRSVMGRMQPWLTLIFITAWRDDTDRLAASAVDPELLVTTAIMRCIQEKSLINPLLFVSCGFLYVSISCTTMASWPLTQMCCFHLIDLCVNLPNLWGILCFKKNDKMYIHSHTNYCYYYVTWTWLWWHQSSKSIWFNYRLNKSTMVHVCSWFLKNYVKTSHACLNGD